MQIEKQKANGANVEVYTFASWGEFVDFAETRPVEHPRAVNNPQSREISTEYNNGMLWAGTETFEETLKLARSGWPEGSEKVKALSDVVIQKVTSLVEKQQIRFDVTGNDFDMGLFMQGVPECWYTINSRINDGEGHRVVRLLYNMGASSAVSASVKFAKGAAIVALIQSLEFAGIRVEVNICHSSGDYGVYLDRYVTVKLADQPLDLDLLTFAVANPASQRRLSFSVSENSYAFMENHGYSYGQSRDVENKADIYIGKSLYPEPQWENEQDCVAWVLEQLRQQGVKLSDAN